MVNPSIFTADVKITNASSSPARCKFGKSVWLILNITKWGNLGETLAKKYICLFLKILGTLSFCCTMHKSILYYNSVSKMGVGEGSGGGNILLRGHS